MNQASVAREFDAKVLLDCVEDAILVVDMRLQVRYANAAALRYATSTDAEMQLHASPLDLVHPDDVDQVIAEMLDIIAEPASRRAVRMRLREEGGGWRPVEAIVTNLLEDGDVEGIVMCFRDLSHEDALRSVLASQRELDQHNHALRLALQERQHFLGRLVRIQSSISRRAPLDDVFAAIVDGASQLFGDVIVALRLRDTASPDQLVLSASHGFERVAALGQSLLVTGAGIGGESYRTNRTVVTQAYDAEQYLVPEFVTEGLTAAMAVPVRSDGFAIGSLSVGSFTRRVFNDTEVEMLEALAEHAGIALMDAHSRETVRLASTDPLTGLPNRRLFVEHLSASVARSNEYGTPLAVLFIDLDGFKAINDSRGHTTGDEVLVQIAQRIQQAVGASGTAARLGGDEFVIALEDSDLEQTAAIAARLSKSIRSPLRMGRRSFYVGATIGMVLVDGDTRDAEQLLRQADIAMYRGKRDGRDNVVLFEPDMEHEVVARAELEGELRNALRRRLIEVEYQPVIDLATGTIRCVEALARWTSRTQGPISPERFVRLAEQMNMVGDLDHVVLDAACSVVKDLRLPSSGAPLPLSVNLSPQHLDATDVVDGVLAVLASYSIAPDRLMVEVTETEAMRDALVVADRLRALRSHGITVAIDDFGTGYSSLAYLEQFPVDVVKLDRRFVDHIAGSSRSRNLLDSMARLGASLGLATIAEGVETPEQAAALDGIALTGAQGFHFAPPASAADLPALLADLHHRLTPD